jgi:Na+/H+-dicarboxylate symporter
VQPRSIHPAIDTAGKVLFRIIGIIVRAAPIGAFSAMAFTTWTMMLRFCG